MSRRQASITSLIITATIFIYLYKPSDNVVLDEIPITENKVVVAADKPTEVVVAPPVAPTVVAPPKPVEVAKVDVKPTEKKSETITVEATHYTAYCDGCTGITKMGDNVKSTIYVNGLRVIAADPRVIPLGSIVTVELEDGTTFKASVRDVGGGIKGARIDVLVSSKNEAYRLGRQQAVITIIERGGN